jgi:cytochrome oxidase Cu insertion factor (SCO1/SenC/PrrC family)
MTDAAARRRSGRRSFLMLASLFFVPFAAAIWLYYSSAWRPAIAAHGELIDPPRLLPAVALTLPDGGMTSSEVLRDAWSLVYLGEKSCAESCTKALAELARVRLALDKDAMRVQRVLLHSGECCAPGFPGPGDEDLLVLGATGAEGKAFLALFPRAPYGAASVYVVDPLGNLMMRHAASGGAQGLLKDLERLLRLSSIG